MTPPAAQASRLGRQVVEAYGLVRDYGARRILDHVTLRLGSGNALLIRGRSGAGKSTLLHLLAGIDVPTSGRVWLAGQDLGQLDPPRRSEIRLRHVGLVFQHFNLIPDLTAEENVRLPMALARHTGAKERSRALLERVGLGGSLEAFPSSLSGGEMQRVGIARALANEPLLLLADEPTANLDETNARLVLRLLADLAREGRAVLVASHDPLAEEFLTTRMDLVGGRLVTPEAAPPPRVQPAVPPR